MAKLAWDTIGNRQYETGIDRGVLYLPNGAGVYDNGYSWTGLTKIIEKPTGAVATPQYADNAMYLNLLSIEKFDAEIEAFTYPDQWAQCDGSSSPEPGVMVGQQPRKPFGLAYRTKIGNDLAGTEFGYKLHLVYNALAAPSQKDYATINENPNAISFTWALTTTPVDFGPGYKPASTLSFNSTQVDPTALANLESFLYGTVGTNPTLPTPATVLAIFAGTVVQATPVIPTYTSATHTIAIPVVTGITYSINGLPVTGNVVITGDTVVTAMPNAGYKFPPVTDNDWLITF